MLRVGYITNHMSATATEEYFDLLDEACQPIGRSCPRSEVHACGYYHKAVHIWLLCPSTQEVLLQRRALCKDSWAGLWDVSSAGHVSAGELPLPSALRELEEELGLSVPGDRLEYVFTHLEKCSSVQKGKPFINNEFQDVYILCISAKERVSLDPSKAVLRYDAPSMETRKESPHPHLSSFALQASEVSAVQWVPVVELGRMYRERDPSIVPWDTGEDLNCLLKTFWLKIEILGCEEKKTHK